MASPQATRSTGSCIQPPGQPLFFPSADQQLYGVFQPGEGRTPAPVVVFCGGFGLDHLVMWRMEVLAARMFAAKGHPSFCYHPRGHGDSTGNSRDVTLAGLVEDALSAADYACHASAASGIVWVASGFGALVAAEAMLRRGHAAALALWEPVHRPRDYFRGLLRRVLFHEVANGRRPGANVDQMLMQLERDGRVGLPGGWLHRTFYRSAIDADLAGCLRNWRGPTLLAQIQKRNNLSADNAALKTSLERRGSRVTVVRIADDPDWGRPDPPWVSASLLRDTSEWLDGLV